MTDYVNLNSRLVKREHAKIPADDRSLRFGDAVFETIRLSENVPYQWELHIARLLQGLNAVKISHPQIDWLKQIFRLMRKNTISDGFIRILVTRGAGSQGYMPQKGIEPMVLIETLPARIYDLQPASLWLSRWQKPSPHHYPTQFKTAQGLNSTLALLEAHEHGCDEALLLNAQGMLCEAAAGNLFWVKQQTLYTPSLESGCLKGTTRDVITRISPYPVKHVMAPLSEMEHAEAVFITNCNWGVRPVKSLSPQGLEWPIPSIINTLQERLESDIKQYVKHFTA